MGKIKINKPGLLTTVQDGGRVGYQQFGVPVSGVMDAFSQRVANLLAGNDENEAVLEITLMGPEIEFEEDMVIAVTGGDLGAVLEGEALPLWQSVLVQSGQKIAFKAVKKGCRAYLAVAGGIQVPAVMGSKATYTRGKIGGYEGRALKAGDALDIGKPSASLDKLKDRSVNQDQYEYPQEITIRVVAGPQEEAFTDEGINTFYSSSYAVTNECDRMGYRLNGPEITHESGGDIISDGIAMGAVQVPGHGMPIVMMADRQTTGGYTKIANVISVDLPKMAQAKPGDQISFQKVTVEEAQQLLKDQEARIEHYRRELSLGTSAEDEKKASSAQDSPKIISRKELFRYRKGGKQYCLTIEEIEE
ncbi:MAG: biotin-dependent carboxyltransferase [Tindallia sp. MSAO_Bac2]|nr:MAG: biotin-dependent carboxyltransferase [Tindallia sp. MSAO_Bac2]